MEFEDIETNEKIEYKDSNNSWPKSSYDDYLEDHMRDDRELNEYSRETGEISTEKIDSLSFPEPRDRNGLIEKLKKSRDRIRRLHEVALLLSKTDNEERIFDLIVDAAQKILNFDIYSLDIVEGENLVVKRISDSVPDNDDTVYSKERGVAGRTLREGRTLVFNNLRDSSEARPRSSDYRSALSLPVGAYGIFQTISTVENAFDDEDIDLAELLTAYTAEAISRVRAKREIFRLTYHDCLTGALSRYGLTEFAEMEIDKARKCATPLALIMLDVDNFKCMNDSLGHIYGDYILSWVVATIKEVVRKSDLVIRWGGDEFIIMLSGSDSETSIITTERIRKHIAEKSTFEGKSLTISAGLTLYKGETDSIDSMIARADGALYEAKRYGKNCFRVS